MYVRQTTTMVYPGTVVIIIIISTHSYLVLPGCPVWDPYTKKVIKLIVEKTQNVALRFIFRLNDRVSFTEIRQKEGIDSLLQD